MEEDTQEKIHENSKEELLQEEENQEQNEQENNEDSRLLTKKEKKRVDEFAKKYIYPHRSEIKKLAEELNAPYFRVRNRINSYRNLNGLTKQKFEKKREMKTISLPSNYFDQSFLDSLIKYVEANSKMRENVHMNEQALLVLALYLKEEIPNLNNKIKPKEDVVIEKKKRGRKMKVK
eukprot:gene7596-11919_t